jgi:hypothetical protein
VVPEPMKIGMGPATRVGAGIFHEAFAQVNALRGPSAPNREPSQVKSLPGPYVAQCAQYLPVLVRSGLGSVVPSHDLPALVRIQHLTKTGVRYF